MIGAFSDGQPVHWLVVLPDVEGRHWHRQVDGAADFTWQGKLQAQDAFPDLEKAYLLPLGEVQVAAQVLYLLGQGRADRQDLDPVGGQLERWLGLGGRIRGRSA